MKMEIGPNVAARAILSRRMKLKKALRDHSMRFGSIEHLKLLVELTLKVERKNDL